MFIIFCDGLGCRLVLHGCVIYERNRVLGMESRLFLFTLFHYPISENERENREARYDVYAYLVPL